MSPHRSERRGASDYLLDRDDLQGRDRLTLQEAVHDAATIRHIGALGIAPGWRCLEVGAGGGSIAAWLCRQVGPTGHVVATDLDPRFLTGLGFANLEVRQHDLASGALEAQAFDLVHARDVLVHTPARESAIDRLIDALAPAGWLLLEEPDVSTDAPDPSAPPAMSELYARCTRAIYAFLRTQGLDPTFGSRLFGLLRARGLDAVGSEGRLLSYAGASAVRSPHMEAFRQLQEPLVAAGALTRDELEAFLRLADEPRFAWREGLTVSAWGRRPASILPARGETAHTGGLPGRLG